MGREIKFRAWHKEEKEYIEDCGLFPYPWNERTRNQTLSIRGDGVTVNQFHESIVLEQFTGLHDKNGKEIYEGDVVKVSNEEPLSNEQITTDYDWTFDGTVINDYFGWGVNIKTAFLFFSEIVFEECDIEIIGNIHENPELLK